MWAQGTYSNGGYEDGFSNYRSGAAATSSQSQQWPPRHGAQWSEAQWRDAYAGWFYQAHSQAAAAAKGVAESHQARGSTERGGSSDFTTRSEKVAAGDKKKIRNATLGAAAGPTSSTPAPLPPAGLSFSELEQRLSSSWQDLVSKEVQQMYVLDEDPPLPPAEVAMPMPSRLFDTPLVPSSPPSSAPPQAPTELRSSDIPASTTAEADKVSAASIFCPSCAEQGGACAFHAAGCWGQESGDTLPSQPAAYEEEAAPLDQVANAMVDQLLDTEDVSTAASSNACGTSGSFSDDWSDPGDVHVSAALLQEGGAWWSRPHTDSPSQEPSLSALHAAAAGDVVTWPAMASPSRSRSTASPPQAKPDQEALWQILAMGFPEADAKAALAHSGHRGVDAAVAFLLGDA